MALDPVAAEEALDAAASRPATLDFLLDHLTSPDWIAPLRKRGLFSEPPKQLIDEQGLVHAPPWAQSRYLARVAAADPEAVIAAIASIQSNNERVAEDFVDAALAMPVAAAARMTRLLARFVNRHHLYYLLPRKLVGLIIHLAAEGQAEASIPLLRALFKPEATDSEGSWRPRVRPRFSDWEYDSLLQRIVKEALPLVPPLFLRNLVKLLEESLQPIRSDPEQPDSDGSRAWRVRVSDDSDRGLSVEEALTSAVRDAAVATREQALLDDAELVTILMKFPGELHRRIAMYALAQGPEPDAETVRRFVLDTAELRRYEPSPEFRDLLRRTATSLSDTELETLVGVVNAGPDVERFRELSERYDDKSPSEIDVERYVGRWKLGRLELLKEALPAEALSGYELLLAAYGPAELPLSFEITTFTGPNSPLTVDELAAKDDDQLIAYLHDWQQPERVPGGEPSIEGLARAFSALSEQDAARVARLAPQLRTLRPAYLQWMFQGFEQAIGRDTAFEWTPLLELAEWIVAQPRELDDGRGDRYADLDPGWVWTRKAIAALIERGLTANEPLRPPLTERTRLWRIIETVADDPDPTSERETEASMDPVTLALNTTRPRAIRAAVAYAIWAYQETFGTAQPPDGGFFSKHAPEVGQLLGKHLDPTTDPATSVRAAIGEFFANLFALDIDWARENASRIFPAEDTQLREAAWGAYVIYTRPYDNVFELLRPVYLRSAQLAASSDHDLKWMNREPSAALGEHLAGFYWRGVIELDEPTLTTYWTTASEEVRAHVITILGSWARDTALDTQAINRLRDFWRYASEHARGATELASFTWWFTAPGLPVDWRVDELLKLLGDSVPLQAPGMITDELPQIAAHHPLGAIRVLRAQLEAEETWFPDAWQEQIERVLRIGLSSRNPETHDLAYDTTNLLLAKGFQRFARVLDQAPSADTTPDTKHPR